MAIADPSKVFVTIPDAFLIAIGKVCVQWGTLELTLELMITKLAGMELESRSKIVFNHMTWPLKVDIFSSLCNELVGNHPRLRDYGNVLTLLKKAQEGRNHIVHGSWGMEDGKVSVVRATARRKLKLHVDEVTVKEIDGVFADINVASVALYNLVLGT